MASHLPATAHALENGLGELPPMGWNSWNLAGCKINETFFRTTVEALASGGFLEAGYTYINLDDCWMDTERDANGDLQWGSNFPTGNTLGDYVHSKGFKFGMYLSAGPKTCSLNTCSHSHDPTCKANRTATGWGSYSEDGSVERRDAAWIAKQGADYLKYDAVCGGDYGAPPLNTSFGILDWEKVVVTKMGVGLNATGRPIWYQYGSPYTWARHGRGYASALQFITNDAAGGGVNSYRAGFDMSDSWGLVGEAIEGVVSYDLGINTQKCTGTCPWPDPDCFEIGNNESRINPTQSQSYFSWFAVSNAPMLMSTRIDTLDVKLKAIFQQREVIAINQNYQDRAGLPLSSPLSNLGSVWGKHLSHTFKYFAKKSATFQPFRPAPRCGGADCGSAAFMVPNGGQAPKNSTVLFSDFGYTQATPMMVRDAVAEADLGVFTGSFTAVLRPSESRLLILTPGTVV